MKKIKAFTLAEVLLTLLIIAVVSAMALPSLLKTKRNQQYVAGFRKAQEVLSSATKRISVEYYGDLKGAFTLNGVINSYAKYINITKNCGSGMGCLPGKLVSLNGETALEDWDAEDNGIFEKAILDDGMSIEAYFVGGGGNSPIAYIIVDTTGKDGPNVVGLDYFVFDLFEDGKILPEGYAESPEDIASDCSRSGLGVYCGMRILTEGTINYSKGSSS